MAGPPVSVAASLLRAGAALLLALGLSACVAPPPRDTDALPADVYAAAEVPGYTNIRAYHDAEVVPSEAYLAAYLEQRRTSGRKEGDFTILALSGGGSDGAYGAGLLRGWTETGTRPDFDIVTGISTGALIAPFAFLGADYDSALERFYTGTTTGDVLTFTIMSALNGGSAVADTEPLRQTLDREISAEVVARIAAEHRKGRRLWIGTTNMDSQRPMLWDIGAIADSGNPDAPALIRSVMLASASIPGAFPPVLFDVEANGQRFHELHADGGVTLSVFVYPHSVNLGEVLRRLGIPKERRTIYVVRNAKITPEYDPPALGVVSIAARSISTLIKAQTISNIQDIEQIAQRDGFRFRLGFVPGDFAVPSTDLFDPVYMKALYDRGRDQMKAGYPWAGSIFEVQP